MRVIRNVDPIALELVNNHLQSLSDEMGFTLARTCASPLIREAQDYAAGYATSAGEVLASCVTSPGFLTSPYRFIGSVAKKFGSNIKPGDIFILNDPYSGGSHLPDIQMVKPIFVGGSLFSWIYTKAHHIDVGGRVPGSMAFDNVDIFQDGFRIPPIKVYEEGNPNPTFFDLLALNIRYPDILLADLNAKIGAMFLGEEGFHKLVREYGAETLLNIFAESLDYAEELARAQIRTWPKGSWEFTDYLDDDMVTGNPLKLHVKLTVKEDSVHADFTGTAPQVPASFNMQPHEVLGSLAGTVRSCLEGPFPMNGGLLRAVSIYAPEGTVCNPRPPAGTSERGLLNARIGDTIHGAMVQCMPQKMAAAGQGGSYLIRIGGKNSQGRELYMFDTVGGGTSGARQQRDATDGSGGGYVEPVELLEAHYPVRVERYELVADTGGPGRTRGSSALRRDYRWLGADGFVRPRIPRLVLAPWGLEGGRPGNNASLVLNPDSKDPTPISPKKGATPLKTGDVVRVTLASGGGWGDPLERDPQLCLKDLLEGVESAEHAREAYGVVINEQSRTVDVEATRLLRRKMGAK